MVAQLTLDGGEDVGWTKGARCRAAQGPREQAWATPRDVFHGIEALLGWTFALDACASPHNAKCRDYYTVEDNGLVQPWRDMTWWNPPYEDIAPWMAKALRELEQGHRSAALVPSRTSMPWFHAALEHPAVEVWFCRGRIRFIGQGTTPFEHSCVLVIGGQR